MKKAILIAVASLFVACIGASATNVSTPLSAGFNLISAPVVPYNSAISSVFCTNTGSALPQNAIWRWDLTLNPSNYRAYQPNHAAAFGGVLLGDAYWVNMTAGATWQYNGAASGLPDSSGKQTDMWISLPKTGNTLIGTPFNTSIPWVNCKMTDGTQTVSIDQAVSLGWTTGVLQGNKVGTGPFFVRTSGHGVKTTIDPFYGYWITTSQDNLALIIPAPGS